MGVSDMKRADYVVLYINQWQRQAPAPEFLAYFERFSPEYVVRIGGLDYARIYDMRQAPLSFQASAIDPVREVNGFLISCAIPADRRPREASFSDCMSCKNKWSTHYIERLERARKTEMPIIIIVVVATCLIILKVNWKAVKKTA
jgi:hypothetical protein